MRKAASGKYGIFILVLLLLTSFSKGNSEKVRGEIMAVFSPLWTFLSSFKLIIQPALGSIAHPQSNYPSKEIQDQILQNQLLRTELLHLRELYQHERYLNIQLSQLSQLHDSLKGDLDQILALQLEAIPAQVIFRSPTLWNNSLWINVGENDNPPQKKIIHKNSPVLIGNTVVGVIDYVGKKQSKVRLITDPQLRPSVRAARGQIQDKMFLENLEGLITFLEMNENILSPSEMKPLQSTAQKLKNIFEEGRKTWKLAKGELCGACHPQNRASGLVLRGTGFNYDFADKQGQARDLRTGAMEGGNLGTAIPILKVNDILITTGMDGVFPPGLEVARVSAIAPLKEGDYYYEIDAISTAGDLNQLSTVFVIPPYGFDFKEQ